MSEVAVLPAVERKSLVAKMADRFGVESNKMIATLKATAFRSAGEVSNEQMMALMIVADQYGLNPWTREIYAFPDKNNGIVPVVGIDGWSRIINSNSMFNGIEFSESPETDKAGLPQWVECRIHRKDRDFPVVLREFMAECKRGAQPWQSHPRRMLRHKSMIQCARVAFGFVGIYDQDEAERMQESALPVTAHVVTDINARLARRAAPALEAQPAQAEEAPEAESPAPTYAEVMDRINGATDVDVLDLAADLIGQVEDAKQREELTAAYKARMAAIEAAQK